MKLLPLPLIGQTLTAVMTVRQMAPPPMTSLVSCPLSPHCHRGNRKVSNCIWPSVMWLSLTSSVMSPVMSCLCFSGVDSSSSTSPPPVCTPPSSSMKSPPPPPASRSSTSNRHHHHHHHQSTKQKRLSSTKSQASSKTDATHIKEVAGDGETISFIVLSLWYVSDNHFFKKALKEGTTYRLQSSLQPACSPDGPQTIRAVSPLREKGPLVHPLPKTCCVVPPPFLSSIILLVHCPWTDVTVFIAQKIKEKILFKLKAC